MSPGRRVHQFAASYSVPEGPESYIALSIGHAVEQAGFRFRRDEEFALDLTRKPPGITRVTSRGVVSSFATVSRVTSLSIAFDTAGRFDHRLLVAPNEGDGSIYAVSPTGELSTVVQSGVPSGGDIGVEISASSRTAGARPPSATGARP